MSDVGHQTFGHEIQIHSFAWPLDNMVANIYNRTHYKKELKSLKLSYPRQNDQLDSKENSSTSRLKFNVVQAVSIVMREYI